MIRFNSDYTEGCHTAILEKLVETNMEQTAGYGEDEYCGQARELIRKACGDERVDVHFLVGGTQTNVTVISAALKHYQGVITAKTGHINVHETGALEACGHKCLCIETPDGKLTAEQIAAYTDAHFADESFEHMVQPKMVYISNPTEIGTIYKKAELEAIYQVCKKRGLYLFMDGARLGYGLMCKENDLTLSDITANTDVFYIGGTKVGALFGEAVVIRNEELKKDFQGIEEDLEKLQQVIDSGKIGLKKKEEWLAIGITVCAILANEVDGMEWKTLIDGNREAPVLQYKNGIIDPMKLTWSRIKVGESCNVIETYKSALTAD